VLPGIPAPLNIKPKFEAKGDNERQPPASDAESCRETCMHILTNPSADRIQLSGKQRYYPHLACVYTPASSEGPFGAWLLLTVPSQGPPSSRSPNNIGHSGQCFSREVQLVQSRSRKVLPRKAERQIARHARPARNERRENETPEERRNAVMPNGYFWCRCRGGGSIFIQISIMGQGSAHRTRLKKNVSSTSDVSSSSSAS
jgi:hypothetical protein